MTFIFYLLAFLATLLSIIGECRNEKKAGIRKITVIGWLLLGVAFLSLVFSTMIALEGTRQSRWRDREIHIATKKIEKQKQQIQQIKESVLSDLNTITLDHIALDIPNFMFRIAKHVQIDIGSMILEIATVPGGAYINENTYVKMYNGQQTIWAGLGQYNGSTNFSGKIQFNEDKCHGWLTVPKEYRKGIETVHLEISTTERIETTLPKTITIYSYCTKDDNLQNFQQSYNDTTKISDLNLCPLDIYINRNRCYSIVDKPIIKLRGPNGSVGLTYINREIEELVLDETTE